jgi:hypothetical protein
MTGPVAPGTTNLQHREQRIREIAHRIWEQAGRPSGQDAVHWQMACHSFELSLAREQSSEVGMRSLDEIIAGAQEVVARSLREAFDEGRAHTASELKNRMASLFEDLVSGHRGAAAPAPSQEEQNSNFGQAGPSG